MRLILAAVLAAACAAPPPKTAAAPGREAREAAVALAASWERGNVEEFFSRFDEDAYPDWAAFQDRARRTLLRRKSRTLRFLIDGVTSDDAGSEVAVKWDEAYVDEDGRPQKASGDCALLLRARRSGGMGLVSLRGDSPFD